MAQRQRDLPFLREQHDLADEELLAPAALAGDWAGVFGTGERFLRDWVAAGRPAAPGRGLGPAAVALAYGLRSDDAERERWLGVLAEIRSVPRADAARGSGYGEVFDAMVSLEQGRPDEALTILTGGTERGIFALVFRQWSLALRAEAAVLSRERRGRPVPGSSVRREYREPDRLGHHASGRSAADERPPRPGIRGGQFRGRGIQLPAGAHPRAGRSRLGGWC